jgi:2'-5' RNA ligase
MKKEAFSRFSAESKKVKRDYSSVQTILPEKLTDHIISWGYDNIPDKFLFFNPDRPYFGREEDIHITIIYGISSKNKISNIRNLLKNINPFVVHLKEVSLFSNEIFDVLKIDVDSPELHQINSILFRNLDVVQIYPKYIPHVTIAYLNRNEGEKYRGIKDFQNEKFQVNNLVFSSKDGTKHEIKLGVKNA